MTLEGQIDCHTPAGVDPRSEESGWMPAFVATKHLKQGEVLESSAAQVAQRSGWLPAPKISESVGDIGGGPGDCDTFAEIGPGSEEGGWMPVFVAAKFVKHGENLEPSAAQVAQRGGWLPALNLCDNVGDTSFVTFNVRIGWVGQQ